MNMAIINFKSQTFFSSIRRLTLLFIVTFAIVGCGLTQTISDGTVSLTKSIFYKQIKILHLDFTAREALNTDDNGSSLSVIVRVFQLKSADTFNDSDYLSLFNQNDDILKSSLLAQKDLRIRPGESIALDMPMEKETEFVAIATMFHTPDEAKNNWRIVIPKNELDPDKARKIVLAENTLTLQPLDKK
ncbi:MULTISPECIES: type VI secretion system lipoprotein TssJ [Proteus]|uniref:Type VI secretion system lipoprotein TssJ n=1 Tax=Proteus appendicitidis TaxID=3034648 RepID=A0ABY8Y5E5_9GAMM|nr:MULTISPECIES: type VI secretion system lipoprotein TssJ [unclassified Proteus (in: enterobacteria)]WIV87629.1 type VI secretion system lipoprotein TssJ [Proteus sp. HZ0627]